MSSFAAQFDDAISSRALLPTGSTCLVGVSGGRDSMLLLRALADWKCRHPDPASTVHFVVAHFNHRLRGAASVADRDFVAAAAVDLDWPFVEGAHDVRAAVKAGESLESAARRLRHVFLSRVAREHGADRIALGHHAGDQAELFLLRLLRGAGSHGLGGMDFVDPSPADPGLALIRPLLGFEPATLELAARDLGIAWREDASNADPAFLRNRVRHELLPWLRERFQPGIDRVLPREAALLRDEARALQDWAWQWLEADSAARAPFTTLPKAVQRVVLRGQLATLDVPGDFEFVEALREHPSTPLQFDPDRRVHRRPDGTVELLPAATSPGDDGFRFEACELELSDDAEPAWKRCRFGDVEIAWSWTEAGSPIPEPGDDANEIWSVETFDADVVGPRPRLRHWRPGDRFEPIGLGQPARLQDLFTNARIPAEQRRRCVLAETTDGRIFWVEGLRIGEIAKIRTVTSRRLRWGWRRRTKLQVQSSKLKASASDEPKLEAEGFRGDGGRVPRLGA